jgi:hypothetical protein
VKDLLGHVIGMLAKVRIKYFLFKAPFEYWLVRLYRG